MDLTLGLFAGISIGMVLMILYGQHIVQQQNKRQLEIRRMQDQLFKDYFMPRPSNLEDQLKAALEREDYIEAERIRNLINKG